MPAAGRVLQPKRKRRRKYKRRLKRVRRDIEKMQDLVGLMTTRIEMFADSFWSLHRRVTHIHHLLEFKLASLCDKLDTEVASLRAKLDK